MFAPIIIAQFGPPSLAAIRSWGKQGARVGMIQIISEKEHPVRSRYLAEHITMTAETFFSQKGFLTAIQFIKDFKADALLTINEKFACHLDENRHMLPNGITFLFSNAAVNRNVLSKSKQIELARSVGFNILPTWEIKNNSNVFSLLSNASFPLCLRPAGTGAIKPGFKAECFFSADEIHKYVKQKTIFKGSIIAQPFIDSPNFIVHGVRGPNGHHYGLSGFLVKRKFKGVALTIQAADIKDALAWKCRALVDRLNVTGPYHFDFLYEQSTDTPWFLELNNRLGGTTAKIMACGYNEPAWILKAFGYEIEPGRPEKRITASSKRAILKYIATTAKGNLSLIDHPDEPRWKLLMTALFGLFTWRDDVFDLHDLKGTLALWGFI